MERETKGFVDSHWKKMNKYFVSSGLEILNEEDCLEGEGES